MSPARPLLILSLALLALHPSYAISYNWTINDQSPLITYTPYSPTSNTSGWNDTYSLSPPQRDSASYTDQIGLGVSSHTSISPNAIATVGFVGTGITVLGQADERAFVIYVDGVSMGINNGTQGVLAEVDGLENTWHQVMISVRGLGWVGLEGFGFTTAIGGNDAQPSESTRDVTDAIYNGNDEVSVTGAWYSQYNTLQANDSTTGTLVNYTALSNNPSVQSTLIITPPLNTSMILLYGIISPNIFSFTSLTNTTANNVPSKQEFNLNSSWYSQQLIFQTVLTPGIASSITITPNTTTYQSISIGTVTFVQDANYTPPSAKKHGLSRGALAGIIIGCIALSLLLILLFLYIRKRRSQNTEETENSVEKIRRPSLASEVHPYELVNLDTSDPNLVIESLSSSTGTKRPIPPSTASPTTTNIPASSDYTPFSPTSTHIPNSNQYTSLPPISTSLPPILGPNTSSTPISSSDGAASNPITLQEKIDSFARFAPALVPDGQAERGVGNGRILREVDAGPVVQDQHLAQEVLAPPGYDPTWARRRE